jgi:hypothetical protein
MKIKKSLKYADFEYDEETKKFLIIDSEDGGVVELNKVYAFAFMRFVIRMSQRNWYRKMKDKAVREESPVSLADHPFNDPDQSEFPF